jgi:beta-galactosidase
VADPLSVVPWGGYYPAAVTGAISSGPLGAMGPQSASSALVQCYIDVANARSSPTNFTLNVTLVSADGSIVASSVTPQSLPSGGWARFKPTLSTGNVALWNTEHRALYTVQTTLSVTGEGVVDANYVRIGVRNAVWSPNSGFTLNGFKVPIQGVSNHQDFAGTGTAVPDRVNAFRVKGLRDIGVNAWRTAHNPTNPELLDFADEQGMLMWVENRFINQGVQPILSAKAVSSPLPSDVTVADAQLLLDAQNMVLRDRNHPSVIIWYALS